MASAMTCTVRSRPLERPRRRLFALSTKFSTNMCNPSGPGGTDRNISMMVTASSVLSLQWVIAKQAVRSSPATGRRRRDGSTLTDQPTEAGNRDGPAHQRRCPRWQAVPLGRSTRRASSYRLRLVGHVHLHVLAHHNGETGCRKTVGSSHLRDAPRCRPSKPDQMVEPTGRVAVLLGEIYGRRPDSRTGRRESALRHQRRCRRRAPRRCARSLQARRVGWSRFDRWCENPRGAARSPTLQLV